MRSTVLVTLATALLGAALVVGVAPSRVDDALYDRLLQLGSRPPPDDIVLVAIDQESIARLGRWPWSRHVHAQLVERLTRFGVDAIGFNVLFAEPESQDASADQHFADALLANGRTVLAIGYEADRSGTARALSPIGPIAQAARALGHVEAHVDGDGVSRAVPLRAGINTPVHAALGLSLLAVANTSRAAAVPRSASDNTTLPVPHSGPWVRDRLVRIGFAGAPGHFRQVSYAEVLRNEAVAAALRDKIVLVGATAFGLHDRLLTPLSGLGNPMAGTEFHANVLDALRTQRIIEPLAAHARLIAVAFTALLCGLLWMRVRRARYVIACGIGLALAALGASWALLHGGNAWLSPLPSLAMLVALVTIWLWYDERLSDSSAREGERIGAMVHSVEDAVIAIDGNGVILQINPAAAALLGSNAVDDQSRTTLSDLFTADQSGLADTLQQLVRTCLTRRNAIRLPEPLTLRDVRGVERVVRLSAAPLKHRRGRRAHAVITISDVTKTWALRAQMEHLSTHDALTGLPNRTLLVDRLQQAIVTASRSDRTPLVALVELDGLSRVNDSLGHDVGDAVLRLAAERLVALKGEADTIARWGDDEFAILLPGGAPLGASVTLLETFRGALEPPFDVHGDDLHISASVGAAAYPNDGDTAALLLNQAQAALRRAKQAGGNRIEFYSSDETRWTRAHLRTEQQLHHAIERDELVLLYQPQVSVSDGRVIGVEALLRWNRPGAGMVGPAQFIGIAEASNLILRIGQWVLRTACNQAAQWQRAGLPGLHVAVNMSALQFMHRDAVSNIRQILGETSVAADSITLELTESTIMRDVASVERTLRALKSEGLRLSIDDFGTGYSSLSHLKRFPIDQLKIDQSFVRDITTDSDNAAITDALIGMGRSMKIGVIAEGVENRGQLDFLRAHGCEQFQGYLFGPPMPAAGVLEFARGAQIDTLLASNQLAG